MDPDGSEHFYGVIRSLGTSFHFPLATDSPLAYTVARGRLKERRRFSKREEHSKVCVIADENAYM